MASPPSLSVGTATTLKCTAADPDGDNLSYYWDADEGEFLDEGARVIWIAPASCGTYTITVIVKDEDSEVSETLEIEVIKGG